VCEGSSQTQANQRQRNSTLRKWLPRRARRRKWTRQTRPHSSNAPPASASTRSAHPRCVQRGIERWAPCVGHHTHGTPHSDWRGVRYTLIHTSSSERNMLHTGAFSQASRTFWDLLEPSGTAEGAGKLGAILLWMGVMKDRWFKDESFNHLVLCR
jgi:hypothetical protein